MDSETEKLPPAPLVEDIDTPLIDQCRAELPDRLDAYRQLVQRYEGLVFSTCQKMLGNAEEAEEISQDSFLRVYQKLHQFQGRSTFKTWLFRIVYNNCLSRRKTLAKRRERMETIGEEISAEVQAATADIANAGAAHDNTYGPGELVHEALSAMQPEAQRILVLRFISDLSLDQMTEVLDIGLSAAKMRLYRAMEQFKVVYTELAQSRGVPPARGKNRPKS